MEMGTECQVTVADKVTEGTVNSCNQLAKAGGTERLEKVKGEGHFHAVKEYKAVDGWQHSYVE